MQIKKYTNDERQYPGGFTLIELLVVISIIGILIALSVFGLQGARTASRDSKRKADLELIRSGLEIYKSDCAGYPLPSSGQAGDPVAVIGTSLIGNGSSSGCALANTYISQMPSDPISPNQSYLYYSNGTTYELCAALEQSSGLSLVTCGGRSGCGSATCNYKVTNP